MDSEPGNDGSTRPRTRVAVIDLDRRIQAALAEALGVGGLEVIGTAGESAAAVRLVADGVDVLLLDPRLPELTDGQALVQLVQSEWPQVRIVIMGWGDTGESSIGGGSAPFVAKSVRAEEFVAATLAACFG